MTDWLRTYSKHPASCDAASGAPTTPTGGSLRELELLSPVKHLQEEASTYTPDPASLINMVYTSPNTPSLSSYNFIATKLWKRVSWSSFFLGTTANSLLSAPSPFQSAPPCWAPTSTLSLHRRESPLSWPTCPVVISLPTLLRAHPMGWFLWGSLQVMKWRKESQATVKLSKSTCDKAPDSCIEFYQLNETQCLLLNKI